MSIETYEQLVGKFELYGLIQEGMEDVRTGNTRPFSEAMTDIRSSRKQRGNTIISILPKLQSGTSSMLQTTLNLSSKIHWRPKLF